MGYLLPGTLWVQPTLHLGYQASYGGVAGSKQGGLIQEPQFRPQSPSGEGIVSAALCELQARLQGSEKLCIPLYG